MKILVTGAGGQLGSDVMLRLGRLGIEAVGADASALDITDRAAVNAFFDRERPDGVIHCAAYTNVDLAETEREKCRSVNVGGTANIAAACAEYGSKLLYTSTDYGDGEPLDLLRTQLIAGQSPDLYLFCTSGYADPGLHPEDVCADLLPLLGEDFTADSLLPGLYGLLTADGALYQLPLEVYVDTMIGPSRLFPSAGMTPEELDEARVEAGDGWVPIESWNTPQNLFGLCTGFCIGAYTDRAAGTCNFQTQGFYDFLTWCRTWGGDGSIAEQPEKALLRIAAATPAALANRSENTETWFGEPGYTYVGFPSPNGTCSAYDLRSALGVSPQCRDTDGAKALLEYCFSYPIGDMPSPASRRLYDALMEEYMAGERKNFFGDVQRISREDAQKAYDLMASITVLEGFDGALDDILSEEAAVFFSGGCTAEEAAAKIQSRASIYLMEHKG